MPQDYIWNAHCSRIFKIINGPGPYVKAKISEKPWVLAVGYFHISMHFSIWFAIKL